jgi:hypothetical protein
MKLISKLFALLVILLVMVFALSNRATVSVDLWPTGLVVDAPLGLVACLGLILGMITGSTVIWLSMIPHQMLSKKLRREMNILKTQLDNAQKAVLPVRPDYDLTMLPRPRPLARLRRLFGGPTP